MLLDDGIVYICDLTDTATPGGMPCLQLKKIDRKWYGERTVGYNRLYAARGADEEVDMLVRVAHTRAARAGLYAMLGNGEQYRITAVQQVVDDGDYRNANSTGSGLRYTDLTLRRVEEYYSVAPEPDPTPTPTQTPPEEEENNAEQNDAN